jgi:very-short-patch-repair endonuclease
VPARRESPPARHHPTAEWSILLARPEGSPTRFEQPVEWAEIRGDRRIAELAGLREGLVDADELAAAGLLPDAIARRVAAGGLRRVHHGIYQVGPIAGPRAREVGALLAVGEPALLSHHSAAALWGFRTSWPGDVHVTVPAGCRRRRPGIRAHRSHDLDGTIHQRLPLTTPARTLLDLASNLRQDELDHAVEQAQVMRLVTEDALARLLRERSGRRGARALSRALRLEPALMRSRAERRLRQLVRAAGLPRPQYNTRVCGHEVDVLWRRARLVIEIDGFDYHSTRAAFERDRRRDAELMQAGFRVVRLTWRQICDEPEAVVARLAALLAGGA